MTSETLKRTLVGQFGHPTGVLGRIAGWVMANRRSNRERNSWAVEQLDVQPGDRVLEIGFGPGLALAQIASRLTTGQVVGVDHSRAMLAQAKHRNQDAGRFEEAISRASLSPIEVRELSTVSPPAVSVLGSKLRCTPVVSPA